jgi:hypothetical protein
MDNQLQEKESQGSEKTSYRIQRLTKLYKDVPVQVEEKIEKGCALDSDTYISDNQMSQSYRQAEDIILLRLNEDELKGSINKLKPEHMVTSEMLDWNADENGYVTAEKLVEKGINAFLTDHTRIGKLDFVDMNHIASEVRPLNAFVYRHDSSIESEDGINANNPTAWRLLGIDTISSLAEWESLEEFTS